MRLTIRSKIKANGRERESEMKGNSEQWNIIEWEGERKWDREKRLHMEGRGDCH